MGAKSKRKGDNFEREVAKIFEKWWGKEVRRAPLSGAGAFKVDIVSDEKFPFLIECKKDEKWRVESILTQGGSKVWEGYIRDLDAQRDYIFFQKDKFQMLVISRNRASVYAVLEDKTVDRLEDAFKTDLKNLNHIEMWHNGRRFYMYDLRELLRALKMENFSKLNT